MDAGASRRRILKGLGGAAFLGASAGVLPLFGTPSRKQTPASCPSPDYSNSEPELLISTWSGYIDPIDEPGSTLRRFERESGVAVRYMEDISDAALTFAKLENQLGTCQPPGRDLFVINEGMTLRSIRLGWLQELDQSRLPLVHANLLPVLRNPAFDPGRRFSVPWQTGFTAIAYNAALVPEVRSFDELISRQDLHGRITLLLEMMDTMSFTLAATGADPHDFDDADWERALRRLIAVRERGHVRAFKGSDYLQDLASGNSVAALVWSGDVVQLQREFPSIRFVVPEEGLILWSDNMQIPNRATHKEHAERWMNFYYQPEIAAKVAAYVGYVCPVAGARAFIERASPELADNPLIFPTEEFLARSWEVMPLDEQRRRRYSRDFAMAIGGGT